MTAHAGFDEGKKMEAERQNQIAPGKVENATNTIIIRLMLTAPDVGEPVKAQGCVGCRFVGGEYGCADRPTLVAPLHRTQCLTQCLAARKFRLDRSLLQAPICCLFS